MKALHGEFFKSKSTLTCSGRIVLQKSGQAAVHVASSSPPVRLLVPCIDTHSLWNTPLQCFEHHQFDGGIYYSTPRSKTNVEPRSGRSFWRSSSKADCFFTATTLLKIQHAPRSPPRSPAGNAAGGTQLPQRSSSLRPMIWTCQWTNRRSMGPHTLHASPLPCHVSNHRSGWEGVRRPATMGLPVPVTSRQIAGMARAVREDALT